MQFNIRCPQETARPWIVGICVYLEGRTYPMLKPEQICGCLQDDVQLKECVSKTESDYKQIYKLLLLQPGVGIQKAPFRTRFRIHVTKMLVETSSSLRTSSQLTAHHSVAKAAPIVDKCATTAIKNCCGLLFEMLAAKMLLATATSKRPFHSFMTCW